MATAISTPGQTAPRDEHLYHPLEKLRGTIRTYVMIEGVLSVLLFFVAWFTAALVLDYGLFYAFNWDWVQDASAGLRVAGLLLGLSLLAGILIFRIARRILVEFSHSALALVLERKFPNVLGDRLITAVELADVEAAVKHGYSPAMIRKTIAEAREQVAKVPVSEVFNWRRLRLMAVGLVLWVLGLVAVGFAAHAISARQFQPVHAAWKSFHVASILGERNLLQMDTPWPRQALLELRDANTDAALSDAGIRVAREASPRVKVRAYRWVIVDRKTPNGWRPLMWTDVTPDLVGMPVPVLLTTEVVTADSILEDEKVRARLSSAMESEEYAKLQKVFDRLEDMAADPSKWRKLRKLDRPTEVKFKYVGLQSAGDGELKSEGLHDYAGEVTGLKEDVLFTVRAADFRTPERKITLVPPPSLRELIKEEYQPAYLHYASPLIPDPNDPAKLVVGGWNELAGLRQRIPDATLSIMGDRTVFAVPAGSEVVLTGVTEHPISKAFAIPKRGRVPGGKVKIVDGKELRSDDPVELTVGTKTLHEKEGDKGTEVGTFTIAFRDEDRVKELVEFDIDLVNSDGIHLTKPWQVLIQVTQDQAPVVEILPEYIRKVGKEYWVTPKAKIPFNSESNIRDEDSGLSKVAYLVTYEPKDAHAIRGLQGANFIRPLLVPFVSGDGPGRLTVAAGNYVFQMVSDDANARKNASFRFGQFDGKNGLNANLKRETLDTIKSRLNVPLKAEPERVTRIQLKTESTMGMFGADNNFDKFRWRIDGDYFDIGVLKGLQAQPGDVQPRYELQLSVEATDTNFDTGPRATRSEPIAMLVVSESDLLVKISEDEERLGAKLDDTLKKLDAARSKYEFVRVKAERPLPDELEAVKIRSKDAWQDVQKARDIVQVVAREFHRLKRECVFNDMNEKVIAFHGEIANYLERSLGENPPPVSKAEESTLGTTRVPKSTFPRVDELLGRGQAEFDQGRFADLGLVVNANTELGNLRDEIAKIRGLLGEVQTKDRLRNLIEAIRDRQLAIRQAITRAKVEAEAIGLSKIPLLGTAGPFFLTKGESKKIRQTIKWAQYEEDILPVKVVASDPSIMVPGELKLDFTKNSLDFEYEVKAGTKEGDYTITLTPVVGPGVPGTPKPVVVQISVK